jgi:predicted membrane GTPase involved in stress response
VPPPKVETGGPFKMLVSMLEYDEYAQAAYQCYCNYTFDVVSFFGKIVTGRVSSGLIKPGTTLQVLKTTNEKADEGTNNFIEK